jgi:hypothetical protein
VRPLWPAPTTIVSQRCVSSAALAASFAQRGAEHCRESLGFLGSQRRVHQRPRRRCQGIRRGVEEDIEVVAYRWRREREFRLHIDAAEAGVVGQINEVAVVESAEQVGIARAGGAFSSRQLALEIGHCRHVISPQIPGSVCGHPDVERLAEREPPTGAKDPAILVDRATGIFDEEQDGALDDGIDRRARDGGQVDGGRGHERRAVERPDTGHLGAAVVERRRRDVREDDVSLGSNEVERGEAEQSLPGADVEDGIARPDLRASEDAVAHGCEPVEVDCTHALAPSVAARAEPRGPDVGVRHAPRGRGRSCPPRRPPPSSDALAQRRRRGARGR